MTIAEIPPERRALQKLSAFSGFVPRNVHVFTDRRLGSWPFPSCPEMSQLNVSIGEDLREADLGLFGGLWA